MYLQEGFMTDQIYFPREVPFQVMCYRCAGHRNLVVPCCIQQVRANNGSRVHPEEATVFAGKLDSLYNVRHILWATFFKTPQAESGSIICSIFQGGHLWISQGGSEPLIWKDASISLCALLCLLCMAKGGCKKMDSVLEPEATDNGKKQHEVFRKKKKKNPLVISLSR